MPSNDTLLRLAGFSIVSRPKRGPNRWKRDGIVYSEPEAVVIAEKAMSGK